MFDEENHEQKLWKFFGRARRRSDLVFLCHFLIGLSQACAIVRLLLSSACEETTAWVAFQPKVDKIFYFYQHYHSLYGQMQIKNFIFIQGCDCELIRNLPNIITTFLLLFDDSCEKISNSKQIVKNDTAERHGTWYNMYTKHKLFHQSKLGRDVELQKIYKVMLKSLRDVLLINTFSQQLGLGSQLKE